MRRFYKELPLWKQVRIFCMLVCLSAALYARETLTQFDSRSSYFFVQPLRHVDPTYTEGFLFNSDIQSTRYVSEATSLQFEHRLRGTNNNGLFPEQMLPFDNYLFAGIRSLGEVSTFEAGYSNELFPYAKPEITPYFLPLNAMQPEMLNAVNGAYCLEHEYFTIDAKSTFFILKYKYKSSDPLAPPPYRESRDADLWTDLRGEIYVFDDFTLSVGWLRKSDLNAYDGYGIDRFRAGLSGEHWLFKRKLLLLWQVEERLLQSTIAEMSGYAVGPATNLSMKLLWKLTSGLFIKGESCVRLSGNLHKMFYQAQLRKLLENNTSFDLGYFSTNGVLFPRQGIVGAAKIVTGPNFAFRPGAEVYFSRFAGEAAFRYYRTDLRMELLFPVVKRFELFVGGGYRFYRNHPLFASRGFVSAGLRSW